MPVYLDAIAVYYTNLLYHLEVFVFEHLGLGVKINKKY